MKAKTGIVDVGGGLRGIYAAGVLDKCLDDGITFDIGIGVSAGSANLAAYMSGQVRRNYKFYTEYAMTKEYMGIGNFIRHGSFINLDYVYGTLCNTGAEYPLDYKMFAENPMELIVVAEEAETGAAKYFTKTDIPLDKYDALKASSAIPFVCKPYFIDGIPYYDGALADPVPVKKAFDEGCDKVVLLLTLPEDTVRTSERDRKAARLIKRKYPRSAEMLEKRAEKYNADVALAKKYAGEGRLIIIAPDDTCGIGTLTRDAEALKRLYKKGYDDGQRIKDFMN